MTTYITFGSDHDNAHPALGSQLSEGFVAIDLPGLPPGTERDLFFELFGARFAFDYRSRPDQVRGHYRKGEIARIQLINEDARRRIVWTLNATFDAADGDSNDAEISVLQEARDLLASLIDYTYEED